MSIEKQVFTTKLFNPSFLIESFAMSAVLVFVRKGSCIHLMLSGKQGSCIHLFSSLV